ncbi:MAG: dihydropteroate synthase [Cyanobacteriota bacterium erpe_2018_sw_21hr_WHONDRS-SW48-000092_B_bin.40]|nr:dihydropteroate synthase [Cyanobacteriota bacterium erpe_2018_sw_21hr_WHONDRS-SW48-000092_B_bin.40]
MASLKIRNQTLAFGSRTFVMAILNVTPDSFSGDGILAVDKAVAQALEQIRLGADLIDIGGQSTRPGHVPIPEEEEAQRILPVIEKLRLHTDTIISIDTYNPAVLQAALSAGGDLLNSIWGLEKGLLGALGEHKCPVVIMHNKTVAEYGDSSSSSSSSSSASPVAAEVCAYLKSAAQDALACGLLPAQIILDPGIGFGKTADHNLEMLANLKQLTALGFPTLLGSSRKSTIGKLTGRAAHERIFGTAATVALGIESGIDIVRVHDVAEILDVVKVSDAIVRGWRPVGWGV